MRGLLHRAATTALLTLLPSVALGQVTNPGTTGTPTTTVPTSQTANAIDANLTVLRDGKIIKNGNPIFAGIADSCQDSSVYEFQVDYSSQITVVEAWLGTGDEDCSAVASRTQQSSVSTQTICTKLATVNNVRELRMMIPGPKVFDDPNVEPPPDASSDGGTDAGTSSMLDALDLSDGMDAGVAIAAESARDKQRRDGPQCDNVKRSPVYRVWILALSKASSALEAVAPNVGAYGVLKATFTPYLVKPDVPEDVNPLSGETRIGLSYEKAEDADTYTKYKAYFDLGAPSQSDTECGTGLFTDPNAVIGNKANIRASSETTKFESYISGIEDIAEESYVQAVAVAIDAAGNESPLSAPVCVKRTQTTSFLDSCKDDPDCQGSLDSCSLSPGRDAGIFGLGLLALALGALIQRRRSR